MCYLRVAETKNGERVSRWKLGGITEYGTDALMETFRDAMEIVKTDIDNGIPRNDVTDILGLLIVSHGAGRWATQHPDTGEICSFAELPEEYQKQVIERADADELSALRQDTVPCRVVNIVSLSGLLGEVTMFVPNSEPTIEINEQWANDIGDDNVSAQGMIDEVLIKTMMLLNLMTQVAREGYDLTPDGLMDYAIHMMKSGHESANDVMALVLKMIAHALENNAFDLDSGGDDDD
jgi:hypothetical protein